MPQHEWTQVHFLFLFISTIMNIKQTYTSSPELKHVMGSYLFFPKNLVFLTDILIPQGSNPYMGRKFYLHRKYD